MELRDNFLCACVTDLLPDFGVVGVPEIQGVPLQAEACQRKQGYHYGGVIDDEEDHDLNYSISNDI